MLSEKLFLKPINKTKQTHRINSNLYSKAEIPVVYAKRNKTSDCKDNY